MIQNTCFPFFIDQSERSTSKPRFASSRVCAAPSDERCRLFSLRRIRNECLSACPGSRLEGGTAMPQSVLRLACGLTVLALLWGIYSELQSWIFWVGDSDFAGYYTASRLVRNHLDPEIYEDADRNVNPLLDYADPNTIFARTANAVGMRAVPPYDYPPTLADLIAPFTICSPSAAFKAWYLLCLVTILSTSMMLGRFLRVKGVGPVALLAVLLILFRPTLAFFSLGRSRSCCSFSLWLD